MPSFKLLYFADRTEDAEMTLKAIGRQWYWSYEYPDHGDITFDSYSCCRTTSCRRASRACWRPTTLWSCRWTPTSAC